MNILSQLKNKRIRKLLSIVYVGFTAIYLLVFFFILLVQLRMAGDIYFFTVESGSMEPAISTGSLVTVNPQRAYTKGDIISFSYYTDGNRDPVITHRIDKISSEDGITLYTTKGDANNISDLNYIRIENIIGRVTFQVPLVGYVISWARTIPGFIVLIILPTLLIIFKEIKNIQSELLKRRANKANINANYYENNL